MGNKYSQKVNHAATVPAPHSCVCERYSHDWSAILLQEICGFCGPILRIYKSLTDIWMWKLGLRPSNSQKRNTYGIFLAVCVYPHLGCPICSRSCKISNSQFQVAINHAQTQVMVNRSHPGYGNPFPPRSQSTVPTQVTVNRSHPGYGRPFSSRSRSTVPTQVTVNRSQPGHNRSHPGHGLPVFSEVKVNQRSSRSRSTCPSKIKVIRPIS
jgi:hypothetical protein